MSMRCFLATEKPLTKTEYFYRNILPSITVGDMLFSDKISFENKLTETERQTIGNVFQDFSVYAIHSGFQLSFNPKDALVVSERFAKNALEELQWFKSFAKKKLLQQDIFMVVNLWLGRETNLNGLKMRRVDVNDWKLTKEQPFEFEENVIYQFYDNSEEAIARRKARVLQ